MIKRLFKLVAFVAILLAAGVLGGMAAFHQCAGLMPFYQDSIRFPAQTEEKQEVIIQENKALKDAFAKVKDAAIAVKITDAKGKVVYGSGVAITSDGLAAVPNDLYPPSGAAEIFSGGEKIGFEVVKRDKESNVAILKLQTAGLFTAGFYQAEYLKLGERIFLAGILPGGEFFVNEGIARAVSEDGIATNIRETAEAAGAPAFDIEGNILGIAQVDKAGQVSVIPIWKIKEASGL
jgi:hypothetical protein